MNDENGTGTNRMDSHESESKALDLNDASICGEFECAKATNWLCQWCSCSWTYQIQEYYFVLKLESLTQIKQEEYHRTKIWQNLWENHWYQDTADAKRRKMWLLEELRVKRWNMLQNRCWNCCLNIQSNFQATFWIKQRHKLKFVYDLCVINTDGTFFQTFGAGKKQAELSKVFNAHKLFKLRINRLARARREQLFERITCSVKWCQIRWAMYAKFCECSTDIVPIGRIPSLGSTEVVGNRQRHCRQAHKDSICNPVNCFKRSCYTRKYKLQIKSVNQRRVFR